MKNKIEKIFQKHQPLIIFLVGILSFLFILLLSLFFSKEKQSLNTQIFKLTKQEANIKSQLETVSQELDQLKNEDQYLRNEALQETIENIEKTYYQAAARQPRGRGGVAGHPARESPQSDRYHQEGKNLPESFVSYDHRSRGSQARPHRGGKRRGYGHTPFHDPVAVEAPGGAGTLKQDSHPVGPVGNRSR